MTAIFTIKKSINSENNDCINFSVMFDIKLVKLLMQIISTY